VVKELTVSKQEDQNAECCTLVFINKLKCKETGEGLNAIQQPFSNKKYLAFAICLGLHGSKV
jgi:hypothetical protein